MAEAFERQPLTHGASIFGALVKVFAGPPEGFDPDRLVPVLRRLEMASLGGVLRGQKGGDARVVAVYTAIIEALASLDDNPLAA